MSQKGDMYQTLAATDATTPSDSSPHARGDEGAKIDGQEFPVNKGRDASAFATRTNAATRFEPSSQTHGLDDGRSDGQQWEVLTKRDADNEADPQAWGMSSHFNIRLGWGKWKFTLFSWDINVKRHAPGSPPRQE